MSVPKDWIAAKLPGDGPKLKLPPDWTVAATTPGEWRITDPTGRAAAMVELRHIALMPDHDREKVLRQLLAGVDTSLRRETLAEAPTYARRENSKMAHAFVVARFRSARETGAAMVHRWIALHETRGGFASLQLSLTLPHAANDRPDITTLTAGLGDMVRAWRP